MTQIHKCLWNEVKGFEIDDRSICWIGAPNIDTCFSSHDTQEMVCDSYIASVNLFFPFSA